MHELGAQSSSTAAVLCCAVLCCVQVAEKITRYIRRNVGDVATLQRYLAK
jgi:hypothetical protein